MKYCSKCGNELFDEAIVCPKCGCATDAQKSPISTKTNKNQLRGTIFIIAGILVIVATILLVMAQL